MKREKPPKVDKGDALALRLLSIRDHSRAELTRKLRARGIPDGEIEASVARLETQGILSDARYAHRLAQAWAETKGFGNRQIIRKLIQKGIPEDLIREAVDKAEEALATPERIRMILKRKSYDRKGTALSLQERQKLAQALRRRGFLWEEIGAALQETGGFEEE